MRTIVPPNGFVPRLFQQGDSHTFSSEKVINMTFVTWWRHKMKTFPCYWPFNWWASDTVNGAFPSQRGQQWRGALMASLICAWTNGWANNRNAGDLRRYRTHYDTTVMQHDGERMGRRTKFRLILWMQQKKLGGPRQQIEREHRNTCPSVRPPPPSGCLLKKK